MTEADPYLELLDSIMDVGMLLGALRREKKPDDGSPPPSPERRNEIDAHVRILEVMEKHLNARKTYYIAQLMISAAGVPKPAFDSAATHQIGERVKEVAEQLNIDLRAEIAPWVGGGADGME